MSGSVSTRILSGNPPRAIWSAPMLFGLSRVLASMNRIIQSLDHLVGAAEQWERNGQPKRLGGLEVEYERVFVRLLDGQIIRLGTLQDAINVAGRFPILANEIKTRAVVHQAAIFR